MSISSTDVSLPVQELSVQALSFSRIAHHIPKEENEVIAKLPLQTIIQRIIDVYNEKKEDLTESEETRIFKKYTFKIKNSYGYELAVYGQIKKGKTRLTARLEEGGASGLPSNSSIDFVCFFFREKSKKNPQREIFGITSGDAWRALRPCIDYTFPIKVAQRILNPRRIVEIARRCLFGTVAKETIMSPEGYEFYKTSNLYYLIEYYKAEVISNASISAIGGLKKAFMKVSAGILRINKKIPLDNYPQLLDIYSKHFHGITTYKVSASSSESSEDEPQEEIPDPLFESLHILHRLVGEPKKEAELNVLIIQSIFNSYNNKDNEIVHFRHRHINDYLQSSYFEIQYGKGKRYKLAFNHPPSLKEVLALIKKNNPQALVSSEALLGQFQDGSLRYKKSEEDVEYQEDLLLAYLEGEVRDKEGQSYFRLGNGWYQIRQDYQTLLQEDYRNVLRKSLIPKDSGAQLPRTWLGNDPKGKLTEILLKEKLGLKKQEDYRDNLMHVLKGEKKSGKLSLKGCYIDESGDIKESHLSGSILEVPKIKKHQKAIEKEILSQKTYNAKKLTSLFKKDAKVIEEALKQNRPVLSNQGFVLNPFKYLLSEIPAVENSAQLQKKLGLLLDDLHLSKDAVEEEGTYNEFYLYDQFNNGICFGPDNGYLVFDRICPFNIEPCDILGYTPETIYLYHVKEKLGHTTRDACSQILNAAKELRAALALRQPHSFLDELWDVAAGIKKDPDSSKKKDSDYIKYRTLVKNQMVELGKEKFLKLFFERKIVFVYSFLEGQVSLQEEVDIPVFLTPDHLCENLKLEIKKSKNWFKALTEQGFLDDNGRITGKSYASSKERFELKGYERDSKKIFSRLTKFMTASNSTNHNGSTIVKLELVRLAQELQMLGFEFKICEIERAQPSTGSSFKGRGLLSSFGEKRAKTSSGFSVSKSSSEDDESPEIESEVSSVDETEDLSSEETSELSHQEENGSNSDLDDSSNKVENSSSSSQSLVDDLNDTDGVLESINNNGFPNVGNSCYINAALQLIFAIPELRAIIEAKAKINLDPTEEKESSASNSLPGKKTRTFYSLLNQLMHRRGTVKKTAIDFREITFKLAGSNCLTAAIAADPKGKLSLFERRLCAQQDTEEFLRLSLDTLGWTPLKMRSFRSEMVESDPVQSQGSVESHTHLSVAINASRTLQQALNKHFSSEEMEAGKAGVDSWKPSPSKEILKWSQEQQIVEYPRFLIVQLKRYQIVKGEKKKITKPILFPDNQQLVLNRTSYQIIGCINHHGSSLEGGHYTADIKEGEHFYHYDDSDVSRLSSYEDWKNNAYIILLKKVENVE